MKSPIRVVFDCNVFLQAMSRPDGPAGKCVQYALSGVAVLFISDAILNELRDVAFRPRIAAKLGITSEIATKFIEGIKTNALLISDVPSDWKYERDPADAGYVNLAISVEARLIVSRDRDLLDLMNDENRDGSLLRAAYPGFSVLTPPGFIELIESPD